MPRLFLLSCMAAWSLSLLVCGGCARGSFVIRPGPGPAYPATTRIPLAIELRLSPEYQAGRSGEKEWFGAPFGAALVAHTEKCSAAVFSNIVVTTSPREENPVPGANAVLFPRIVLVEQGNDSPQDPLLRMKLAWSMHDPAGKLLWIDTFKAQAAPRKEGSILKRLQGSFDDVFGSLFSESFRTMLASPDIRRYAERVNAPGR